MNKISGRSLAFREEKLKGAFGFKGNTITELWHVVCRLETQDGTYGVGVGVQSILWSDPITFAAHTPAGGNVVMLAITEYALQCLLGEEMTTPPEMLQRLCDMIYPYARQVTRRPDLPKTFVLNALVPIDFALWQLWSRLHGITSFDSVTEQFCPSLSIRQKSLGRIPLISYDTTKDEIGELLDTGTALLKIKIGSAGRTAVDYEGMLEADIKRLKEIHTIADSYTCTHTDCGKPLYYLDANGRYDSLERMQRFLTAAKQMGALNRIVLLEEPFPENKKLVVRDLPVRVAADESAHGVEEALERIAVYGYGALALKPVAKTLSETLAICRAVDKKQIPCFCADLTVPPVMLEWNMQVAARLACLPGMNIGVLESNGEQNYTRWKDLADAHPLPEAEWIHPEKNIYYLTDDFYNTCAAFLPIPAYEAWFRA